MESPSELMEEAARLAGDLGLNNPPPTILKVLETLTWLGIVREATGRRRNRVFEYRRYMELLNRDA